MFTNENRNRYYGKRVGDIVVEKAFGVETKGEVVALCSFDNNTLMIKTEEGKEVKVVAEWCQIITKVDDITEYVVE